MSKKLYLLLLLLILNCARLFAQKQVPAWAGGSDYNDYSFGFHFEYVSSDFKILKQPNWRAPYYDKVNQQNVTDSVNSISSKPSQGFAVGFLARLRVTDNFELRTTPALVFADRVISYTYATASQNVDKTINASLAEIPVSFKLKSDRLGNVRAYLLGGVKYSYNITAFKKEDPNMSPLDKMVNEQRSYASYEAGAGLDIYFTYFKFSPEVKVSNSFGNMLVVADNPYSSPIEKLFLHSLVFSIYFE